MFTITREGHEYSVTQYDKTINIFAINSDGNHVLVADAVYVDTVEQVFVTYYGNDGDDVDDVDAPTEFYYNKDVKSLATWIIDRLYSN